MIYNTGETSESLRNRYNPSGSLTRKAQDRMYEMLLYIDNICKEQNIHYILDGGTVLGAVRHEGFIPWDDDLDLAFERKEWNKLIKYLRTNPNDLYVLQDYKSDNGYLKPWAVLRDKRSEYIQDSVEHNMRKYRGLQIDLFPFDSGNIVLLQKVSAFLYIHLVQNRLNFFPLAQFNNTILNGVIYPLFRCFNVFGNKNLMSHSYGTFWIRHFHDRKHFDSPSQIHFEGGFFPGPYDPSSYLQHLYGDYLKLPPEDKRDHHQATLKIWD